MKHITQLKYWSVEVKEFYFRRTAKHGEPFTASLVGRISAGKLYFELLLGDELTVSEIREIERFAQSMGFDNAHYERKKKHKL